MFQFVPYDSDIATKVTQHGFSEGCPTELLGFSDTWFTTSWGTLLADLWIPIFCRKYESAENWQLLSPYGLREILKPWSLKILDLSNQPSTVRTMKYYFYVTCHMHWFYLRLWQVLDIQLRLKIQNHYFDQEQSITLCNCQSFCLS